MKENLIPAGKYIVVIQAAEVLPWGSMPHRAVGLTMLIDEGPQAGRPLFRWLFFDAFQPDVARNRFGRLGGTLGKVEEIDKDLPALIGNRLRVRLCYDAAGRAKPMILGYAGRLCCEQLTLGR